MDEITRNADGVAVIHLANMRGESLVDDEDWSNMMQYTWYIKPSNKTSYAQRHELKKSIMMHQHLTGRNNMDHINRNGLDNRRANLRPNDKSGNGQNQGERIGTTSSFLGVVQKENGKWQAQIVKNGHQYHLGVYKNEEDAARAYNAAAPLYYDGPKLNDVPDLPEGVTLESRRVLRYPDRGQPDPVEDAAYFPEKYLGVTKRAGSYQVQMSLAGVIRHLGNYPRPSMAAKAYNEAMLKIYDDPKLNQVEEIPGGETCLDSEMAKFLDTYVKEELGGKPKKQRGPSSIYKGVTKTKGGKFKAYVCVKRVVTNLGTFASEIEAAKAHNKKALEVFENPVLNDV
ncbi:g1018 [Coccomyxa elongata]